MEMKTLRRERWNAAGKAGLIFGVIPVVHMYLNRGLVTPETNYYLGTAIHWILWIAKFIGCIWLMKHVMSEFVSRHTDADNSDTFRLGMTIAFLSALIFSAFSFADIAYISPDLYKTSMPEMMEALSPMMSEDELDMFKELTQRLPQITFFGILIRCFIYGTVLSFILSRSIPSRNPFENYKPDQQ